MTSQSKWEISPITANTSEKLFFDDHQWATIEDATARIIPTDNDPGAREANVVRFIDRYLFGIDYIYANADGNGFLKIDGKDADVWKERIQAMRNKYIEGIKEIDGISLEKFGAKFIALNENQQDEVLITLSPESKQQDGGLDTGGAPPSNQPVSDEGLDFFHTLVLHTRQGFYSDPAYGGNKDHVGWKVIGFPGPKSLAETRDGTYTTEPYLYMDLEWPYPKKPDGTIKVNHTKR